MRAQYYFSLLISIAILALPGCSKDSNAIDNLVTFRTIPISADYLDRPESGGDRRRLEIIRTKDDFTATLALYYFPFTTSQYVEEVIDDIDFSSQQVLLVSFGFTGPDQSLKVTAASEESVQAAGGLLTYVTVELTITRTCDVCVLAGSGRYPMYLVAIDTRKPIILKENMELM